MTALLAFLLTFLARMYQWRFRPRIVAITGNTGKTTTKEAVAAVLATHYRVRAAAGNLNNELGIPLTILGDFFDEYYRTGGTAWFWMSVLLRAKLGFWKSRKHYPEILVLEYGADHPGDIEKLVRRFPPQVSVVTQVGEVPVHVEFFASAEHLAQEKMQIVKRLAPQEHAVLNFDDLTVLEMREHTDAQVRTFGLGEGADIQARDLHIRPEGSRPEGVRFDMTTDGSTMPVVVNGTIGRGIVTACAAAVAVGSILDVGLADAVQALSHMRPPPGRMRLIRGIKDTLIVDDTYNASPAAMHLALDTIRPLPGRKVLVLGDMLELGEHSIQAHQSVGDMAGDIADILVCVGERAKVIADSAGNQMDAKNIKWFHDSQQAAGMVQELLRPGDLVLVKGSQGKRMERVVREIMAEPERAGQLLVRQSARWLAK